LGELVLYGRFRHLRSARVDSGVSGWKQIHEGSIAFTCKLLGSAPTTLSSLFPPWKNIKVCSVAVVGFFVVVGEGRGGGGLAPAEEAIDALTYRHGSDAHFLGNFGLFVHIDLYI
jgi:hypothetical protein